MRLIFFLLTITLVACVKKEPVFELDHDKMVRVLIDLHIAEAALAQVNLAERDSIGVLALKKVAEMHQMTPEDIESKIVYIQQNPLIMAEIYEHVLDTLDYFTANAETLSKVIKKVRNEDYNNKHHY